MYKLDDDFVYLKNISDDLERHEKQNEWMNKKYDSAIANEIKKKSYF